MDLVGILNEFLPKLNATIENWIPREVNEITLKSLAGPQRYECDILSLNQGLFSPIWEILDRGGKRWRSFLILLIAEILGCDIEKVLDFAVITEIIHNGTLIIDDIEDDSEFRRGKPCLHKLSGIDVAVNAGNAMYFLPLRILQAKRAELPSDILLKCYEVYTQEMINLHIGQGLDILWHSKSPISKIDREPSIDNYLQMCANKTGGLARMSAKIGALICGGTDKQVETVGRFAETIGIAFQIQDDLLNLQQNSSLSNNKGGIGEDIHEGKRTIMVIHCLETSDTAKAQRLKEILSMNTSDPHLISEVIEILSESKSFDFARRKSKELVEEAWQAVDTVFPASSSAKLKLRSLVDFLVERQV